MKQIIKYSLVGIGLYLLAGIVFYGYHQYMLPTFLLLMAGFSFFIFRKKEQQQVRKGLIWVNIPILTLLTVTSLFTDNFRVVLTYLIFTPLVAILIYFMIYPTKRFIFFVGILAVVLLSFYTFSSISGAEEIFDTAYFETVSRLIKK